MLKDWGAITKHLTTREKFQNPINIVTHIFLWRPTSLLTGFMLIFLIYRLAKPKNWRNTKVPCKIWKILWHIYYTGSVSRQASPSSSQNINIYVVVYLHKSAVRTNGLVRLYAIAILRHLQLRYPKSDFIFKFPVLELC